LEGADNKPKQFIKSTEIFIFPRGVIIGGRVDICDFE